ncbi:CUB and zona pellucida-like domain-containing protein 1 [Myxocyprinus asiaticus]|uniref:CUB and zona pellucida-like domain-containing protein 1 n=1 Tax=Myxocyprinus asiaticus TaxID=70543 RepID=UPI0022221EFE|nr:CUB and zona pellucida-like domain-containing protein 1 [Myxocyprinus asiaticus]
MMSPTLVLNLLLLVTIASAGHYYGGSLTFSPKGMNPDGSIRDTCTLEYSSAYSTGVYGFELVLEDFPRQHISLSYTDGTQSYRCPLVGIRSLYSTTHPTTTSTRLPVTITQNYWWWWGNNQQTTTAPPTTNTLWWGNNQQTTTAPPTTTPWWWWYNQQTTTAQPSTTPWWLWLQLSTTPTTTHPHQQHTTTTIPPHPHSHDPLSKIPLQFSLLVDPPAPSCTEGLYIPQFVSPTPRNRDQIHATPLRELEIRVKAAAAYSMVSDVIISGPLNITKHPLSTGEYAIRWTPMREDLGDNFPVCFIAESSSGYSIYQSEMRCVIVTVGRQTVEANVICTGTNMVIEIEQANSVGLHKDYLRLNNPACTLDSNGTHVLANFSLNACGTMIEEDDQFIIFKNEIISTDDPNSIITRKHEVEIEFSCRYEKSNNVSLQFKAQGHTTTVTERGFGTLTYRFGLFETADFTVMMDPNTYPVEYDLGQMIYMQIESQSSINNTEIFISSCVATPYNDPNYQTPYSIIQNGCILDETVQFYTIRAPLVRFAMQAFKFIGLQDQVFISCSVILCEANNPNTRCSQGCINSTVAPPSHHHRRREAPIQTSSHFVSQGPLRLKRSVEREVSSTTLNLNLVFIAGCLLAAVGMVCAVLIFRTRRPEVKYQPLQTNEI